MPLNISDDLSGICLVPASVKCFGRQAELNEEVAGQVLGLDLAPLLPPQPQKGILVIAHDDSGIRAADILPPVRMRVESH